MAKIISLIQCNASLFFLVAAPKFWWCFHRKLSRTILKYGDCMTKSPTHLPNCVLF